MSNPRTVTEIVRFNLLEICKAYRKATGASLSDVSRRFYGRGNFFSRLKKGDKIMLSVPQLDKMLAQFRAEWPVDADWPLTRTIFMGRTHRG
jgi:hypothetical protein